MSAKNHYSSLELDTAWAQGLGKNEAVTTHLASCTHCSAYIEMLRQADREPMPAAPQGRVRRIRNWALPAATTLALAAAVLVFVRQRPEGAEGYVGTKGTPAVQLLVRRDRATKIWDGRESVQPGDALAVHVACEGFAYVTVVARNHGHWVRASDSPCPRSPGVLPFTLVVDGEPGGEQLGILLSRERLDDDNAVAALDARPSEAAWGKRFELAKERAR